MEFKYFFFGVFFTLFIIFISVILFNLGKGSKDTSDKNTKALSPTIVVTPTSKQKFSKDEVFSNIKYSFEEGSFSEIYDYLDDTVTLGYVDEKKLKKLEKSEIIDELNSLEIYDKNWIFDQESEIVKSLEATFPENFSNSYICYSDDFFLISFQLNDENIISKVFYSESYKELLESP